MLITLAKVPEVRDIRGIAREMCADGRAAIRVASDLLERDRSDQ